VKKAIVGIGVSGLIVGDAIVRKESRRNTIFFNIVLTAFLTNSDPILYIFQQHSISSREATPYSSLSEAIGNDKG
jgi:hypothetical protein